jgi:Cu/Zn superoxide dismutase
MPMFMHYDGIDGDETRPPRAGGSTRDAGGGFTTGETQVHIESPRDDSHRGDLIFGGDDGAADPSNVEIMVKLLDGPSLHAQGETLVHVESGWLLA